MPERAKVRWSQLKVGVVGLSAFLILFVLVFLLTSSKGLLRRDATLRTFMDDASGIADGSLVRLNGISVGYLDKLELHITDNPKRAVEFDMKVRAEYLEQIPVDSVVGISAANLLGDKFLNITKGKSPQHVKDGDELASLQAQDIPELMAQSYNLLNTLQTIIKRLDNVLAGVEAGKGNLGLLLKDDELYRRLNNIVAEGQKLMADVRNSNGTIAKLIYDPGLYEDLRKPLQRVDAMLADLNAGQGTAGKLLKDPALYDELQGTVRDIRGLVADVNAGKGTAGKLIKDEQLHQQLTELLAKLNRTVDRIDAGQGTIGQFMVNPQLYEALTGATREFQGLAKDMHANPKKFLTIRLAIF